jgi:hypothetical protein
VQKYVVLIYILPISIVLAIAFFRDLSILKQPWYNVMGRVYSIGSVFAAELFATLTDILLLRIGRLVGGPESEATMARKKKVSHILRHLVSVVV